MEVEVRQLQRESIQRMLDIGPNMWKVLVTDRAGEGIVTNLIKGRALQGQGVTLSLALNSDRTPVPDAPAVYLVAPTEANIARICADLGKGLYRGYYLNFITAIQDARLQQLVDGAQKADAGRLVLGVFDRYLSFSTPCSSLFTLNIPQAYQALHSPGASAQDIARLVERIADGLLSTLITMRVLPVICCSPGDAAERVGRRLQARIRTLIDKGDSVVSECFSGAGVGGALGAGAQRTLMCIVDRDLDLATALQHTVTYQSMVHDVLEMRNHRLRVPVDSGEGDKAAPPKNKTYDLSEDDAFWKTQAGELFPIVMDAASSAFDEWEQRRKEMTTESRGDLVDAVSATTEMATRKASIDMHTNILWALLAETKARGLDRYYEMEEQFASQSLGTSVSQLEDVIADSTSGGTVNDKTRSLMVLYLTKPAMPEAQLDRLLDALSNCNGDLSGVMFLKKLVGARNLAAGISVQGPNNESRKSNAFLGTPGALLGLAEKVTSKVQRGGGALLAAGMNGIRRVVASQREPVVCQVLDSLMEQRSSSTTQQFIFLDPKTAGSGEAAVDRTQSQTALGPFRKAITFVVGGGSFAEMHALQRWSQTRGRHVTFGSTEMVAPDQFLEELANLGKSQDLR